MSKSKKEKILEYEILGDAFMGSFFNGDLDNTSENLIMSMEYDKIQNAFQEKYLDDKKSKEEK